MKNCNNIYSEIHSEMTKSSESYSTCRYCGHYGNSTQECAVCGTEPVYGEEAAKEGK